jgi:AraC-like DNA-binding protein
MRAGGRTMTRRLKQSGHEFRALRDEVRQVLAVHYLTMPNLPLRDVPARLGLSGLPVLCKLCQRWFGMTPRTLRSTFIA